ncbi:hypothetical protein ACIBCM_25620 [Streptomyces sp. NPDC051018]|uniref:hypothetical protein n=1 Tax=Streptomyces sp. NPDC051018 TaxID=3365639 RepID=UPI0037ADEA91
MSSDQQFPYEPYRQQPRRPYDPYAEPHPDQQGLLGGPGPQGGPGHQGHQGQQGHQGHPGQQGPYDRQGYGQQPYPQPQSSPVHQAPAQTWEGETWDTQYQPTVPPSGPGAAGPGEQTAYLPPVPAAYTAAPTAGPAEETAYLPLVPSDRQPVPPVQPVRSEHGGYGTGQGGHGSGATEETAYLPPVPPVHTADASDQTAYLPPVTGGSGPLPPEVPYGTAAAATGPAGPAPAVAPVPPGPPAGTAPGDGYSSPTVGGNTRVTDAQRARAEGRSPIIAPGIQPAGLTAVLGLLLAGGAAIGSYALLVPLVVLQAVTAAGWFRLNGMWPARQGIALAFAGGLAADAVLLGVGRENGPAAIVGTLGVWILITLVLQLRSRAGADERMQGLMATVASAALTILAAGYLASADDAVVIGGIAVAVAAVARALPLPPAASVALSLLASAGAGLAAGALTDMGARGALLGLAAGVLALVGLRVASYDYPSRFVHFTAGVALPLTAAAPALYLLGGVLT